MIDTLLDELLQGLRDDPGEPYCAACWYGEADVAAPLELNEDGNLACTNCEFVVVVKGVSNG